MSLERDRTSELPGVEQLLARLEVPRERLRFSASDWCGAITALCLRQAAAHDGEILRAAPEVFAEFVQYVEPTQRLNALVRLGSFVTSRRGQGWRALLLFALGEGDMPLLCSYAAQLAVLNAPGDEVFGLGAVEIARMLSEQTELSPAALGGVLELADVRLLPCLAALKNLPDDRLVALMDGISCRLTSLSAAWVVSMAERPPLREAVTDAIVRMAGNTQKVQDMVQALPVWRVSGSSSAVLHEYTLAEFAARLRSALTGLLHEEQLARVTHAMTCRI